MRTGVDMYITDFNDPKLPGKNPSGEYLQQALMLSPNADSSLPSHPDVICRKEGTALLELESIIREQLETACQGICPLNDKTNKKRCKPPLK
jgi:hypothetical protein